MNITRPVVDSRSNQNDYFSNARVPLAYSSGCKIKSCQSGSLDAAQEIKEQSLVKQVFQSIFDVTVTIDHYVGANLFSTGVLFFKKYKLKNKIRNLEKEISTTSQINNEKFAKLCQLQKSLNEDFLNLKTKLICGFLFLSNKIIQILSPVPKWPPFIISGLILGHVSIALSVKLIRQKSNDQNKLHAEIATCQEHMRSLIHNDREDYETLKTVYEKRIAILKNQAQSLKDEIVKLSIDIVIGCVFMGSNVATLVAVPHLSFPLLIGALSLYGVKFGLIGFNYYQSKYNPERQIGKFSKEFIVKAFAVLSKAKEPSKNIKQLIARTFELRNRRRQIVSSDVNLYHFSRWVRPCC